MCRWSRNQMAYRNRKLLDLARNQACVNCGAEDGTVVPAHSNLGEHGKGKSLKADDSMVMWLCHTCHSELDQGKRMSRDERREFTYKMILRTYARMWEQGLIQVAK